MWSDYNMQVGTVFEPPLASNAKLWILIDASKLYPVKNV